MGGKNGDIYVIKRKRSNEIDLRIGANVRRVRERIKMSQAELARRLGTTQGRVSDIETGKRRTSVTFIDIVSEILDCDPVELLLKM